MFHIQYKQNRTRKIAFLLEEIQSHIINFRERKLQIKFIQRCWGLFVGFL